MRALGSEGWRNECSAWFGGRAGSAPTAGRERFRPRRGESTAKRTREGKGRNPSISCATVRLAIFVAAAGQPCQRHHECDGADVLEHDGAGSWVLPSSTSGCLWIDRWSSVRGRDAEQRSGVQSRNARGLPGLEKGCCRRTGAANGASDATSVTDG